MRKLIVVGLLAFAVALTGTAYAEVQNIKVSGDLDMKAISHHNYDLKLKQKNESGHVGVGPITNDDNEQFLLSTLHINVDADLTDNVSTSVRLLNQRKWDAFTGGGQDQITLDNAYVTLKEFLYSPLTIVAGRQNLVYGSGFIVGNGLLADPETVFPDTDSTVGLTSPTGREFSAFNAFDAVRAILDYSPLTIEGVYAKVNDTGVADADETLYGIYGTWKADRWDATVEPYWFYKDDSSGAKTVTVNDAVGAGVTTRAYEVNRVQTVGLRLTGSPIENLKLEGEGAHQFGTLIDTTAGAAWTERNRSAWAANIYANYAWAQVPWTPATGLGWTFFSGNSTHGLNGFAGDTRDRNDTFNGWDPVYRGSFTTFIQDFLTGADAPAGLYTTFDANDTAATTNRHLIYGDAKLSPMKDLTLWARYTHARFDKAPRPGRSHHAGDEVDVKALYDYTEDVQLNVFGGWFFPGNYYDQPASSTRGNDLAWTVGAGGAVKF